MVSITNVGAEPITPTRPKRSRVAQVAKVPIVEQQAFQGYAERLGLNMSDVAILLLARELRLKRLERLRHQYAAEKGVLLDGKIIAYLHGRHLKDAFQSHASLAQMGPGPAAAVIFRAELREQWLERAIGMC